VHAIFQIQAIHIRREGTQCLCAGANVIMSLLIILGAEIS
jgi:hypothetical protein